MGKCESKESISKEEFSELEDLIDKGKDNFSEETHKSAEYLHPLDLRKKEYTYYNHFNCRICF